MLSEIFDRVSSAKSIYAFHTFDWPSKDEISHLQDLLSRRDISTFLMKRKECDRVAYSPVESCEIARQCRLISLTLQLDQPVWLKLNKMAKKAKQISAMKESLKLLSSKHNHVANDGIIASKHLAGIRLHDFSKPDCDACLITTEETQSMESRKQELGKKIQKKLDRIDFNKQSLLEFLDQVSDIEPETGRESPWKPWGCKFLPGPVGDLPLHDCFLLDLKDMGKQIAEKYFNTPELLSLPYSNDLDVWRKRRGNSNRVEDSRNIDGDQEPISLKAKDEWEDGLYTGETVLHIAIVKEDVELVEWLLRRGAALSSRACGAFFQPKWMRPKVSPSRRHP